MIERVLRPVFRALNPAIVTLLFVVTMSVVAVGCSLGDDPTVGSSEESSDTDRALPGPEAPDTAVPDGDGEPNSGDAGPDGTDPGGSGTEDGSDGEEGDEAESSERIVIETADGHLYTVRPDGTDRVDLTDPTSPTDNSQAAWSPDGSRIAWSQIDTAAGESRIRTDRYDGSSPVDSSVEVAPFYLSWAPTSAAIAYLAPSVGGFDLGIASVNPEEPDTPPQRLDRGAPYYFAWGPDDDELLVHASDFRLDRINVDGETRIIDENPSSFGAPIWAPDEVDSLVFGRKNGDSASVVATGQLGEGGQVLVHYNGTVRMVVSPAMNRVALLSVPLVEGEQDSGGLVTASAPSALARSAQSDPTPTPAPFEDSEVSTLVAGELTQVGIYGGEAWALSTSVVLAFYWDPTGSVLAWLEQEGDGAVRWNFANDSDVWSGPAFVPSDVFATEYLPFFDQYAQSHSFFSPSGESFVFAGTLLDGQEGVFVSSTQPSAEPPLKIGDGVVAQWSPTNAGGGGASPL